MRVLESPPDLSPEVALTQHGNAPGLTFGRPANRVDCEERTGVGCFCVPYGPQLLLTEPAASVSWEARVSEIPGLSLQAICGVQLDSSNTYQRSVSKNRAFRKGEAGLSLAP